jgi:hypothetical protein
MAFWRNRALGWAAVGLSLRRLISSTVTWPLATSAEDRVATWEMSLSAFAAVAKTYGDAAKITAKSVSRIALIFDNRGKLDFIFLINRRHFGRATCSATKSNRLAIIKSMHHIDIVAADIQDFNRILRKSAGKINRTMWIRVQDNAALGP